MTSFLDRLLGRPEPPKSFSKAIVSTAPWSNSLPLSSLMGEPQDRAAAYLRAYKVGWFYKAGRKIADDISSLDWTVSDGDAEEGEDETTLDRPDLSIPFDSLSPIDQFQRLLERPNPNQTGRQLLRKTQVRLDFAGAAAWYLEGGTFGLPTAIYGISPTRMWPAYDKSGQLIGWVMDRNSPSGGVPFAKAEILWFSVGNADDDDIWGTSVVESVYSQVPLTDLMARHTANVLTTGGRLAGMMWPKERALTEDEFLDAQRAWRNVASDPDAGKRLLIFPEPMEYAQGASTPAEIGIPELASLNRDEILTAFPISPYRLGVPMPGGLNSAETRKEDRRDYWEGTIHPRADLLEETIQVGLLSRYELALGQTFDFEIQEPDMDDAPSLTAKAQAFKDLVGIGLDPTETLKAVGLNHIKFLGLPELIDPVAQAQAQQEAAQAQAEALANRPAPPQAKAVKSDREELLADDVTKAHELMDAFFREQLARVSEDLRRLLPPTKVARAKAMPDGWWDDEREDRILKSTLASIYREVGRSGLQVVADRLGRVFTRQRVVPVLDEIARHGGERIVGINDRTKDAIVKTVSEGTRRGYSIPQLVEGVPDEGFPGVSQALLDNGVAAFSDVRAETIARTETALAYNHSTLVGYQSFGVAKAQAIDGDGDEECAARDGQVFDIEEALSIEDHPNGTLDWIPVLGEKSVHETPAPVINLTIQNHLAPGQAPDVKVYNDVTNPPVTVNLPETAAPVVNVPAPVVNVTNDVKTPSVNVENKVETPSVTVRNDVKPTKAIEPVVNVTVQPDLRITSMPQRVTQRVVKRDAKGAITETTEVESDL